MHFGSINNFSQASLVFLYTCTTFLNTSKRTIVMVGLALAGMWRIVAHFSLKTSSKIKVNAPLLLFKELSPELLGGLSELNSTSRLVHFWRCELECDLATSWEHCSHLYNPFSSSQPGGTEPANIPFA